MSLSPRSHKTAFTLIELLVVIAIIAILAAILFPVFAQARAKARQTACLSNEKQMGIGMMLYAQDYDETLPGNSSSAVGTGGGAANVSLGFMQPATTVDDPNLNNIVARDIQPYVKNVAIFVCPDSRERTGSATYADSVTTPGGGSDNYIFNGIVMFQPISTVKSPANVIFVHEGRDLNRYCAVDPYPVNNTKQDYKDIASGSYTGLFKGYNWNVWDNYHAGGGNLLYCDGHAKWSKKNAIPYTAFGTRAGTGTGEVNPADRKLVGPGESVSEITEGNTVTFYAGL